MMFDDPIVAEIRKIREEIAAQYDYDLDKMFAHWQEMEKAHPERVSKSLDDLKESEHIKKIGS